MNNQKPNDDKSMEIDLLAELDFLTEPNDDDQIDDDQIDFSNIVGPKSLTLCYSEENGKFIYLFGESHIAYKSNLLEDDDIRVPLFFKNLLESYEDAGINTDLYIEDYDSFGEKHRVERTFGKYRDYLKILKDNLLSGEQLEKGANINIKDLHALRAILTECSSLYSKDDCEYKNSRVHLVDIRRSDSLPLVCPFLQIEDQKLLEDRDKCESNALLIQKRLESMNIILTNFPESYIYKKIIKNIYACPADTQKILLKDLEIAIIKIHEQIVPRHIIDKSNAVQNIITPYIQFAKLKDVQLRKDTSVYDKIWNWCEVFVYMMNTPEDVDTEEIINKYKPVWEFIFGFDGAVGLSFMDIYTVARMLRQFEEEPFNIIYYGGHLHYQNIKDILTRLNFKTVEFDSTLLNREMRYPYRIDISAINNYSDFFDRQYIKSNIINE
jgi:hypothetical protein